MFSYLYTVIAWKSTHQHPNEVLTNNEQKKKDAKEKKLIGREKQK